jgi:chromate reductase, NAD(P)H dehydrogenase (quinone)
VGATRLLLVSGSTRRGSTNTAVLATARALAPPAVDAVLLEGLRDLPAFDPDLDAPPLPPAVAALRGAVNDADAVLFCTPEYAGDLPGAFKNLLDWLIGDADPRSIHRKPTAWLNVSSPASPTGGADAHASLARVLGYAGAAVVDPACLRLPMGRDAIGDDGLVTDDAVREGIVRAVGELVGATAL